ncbi:hypothetical protein WB66_12275 [bacteria symbiont BFo1 of Frankliniella occidentalis]|nr:hypothetical protein AI28_12415 [bacteria symbiont BFo1 of Frankliniella occidentalis]KYP84477.1 hypothetical protein WB66_12275 [bacteria symbiont BFo1 of Frankliniella occidentalis]
MLIRVQNDMEKWMSITYEDIKRQRIKLDELYSKRQRNLQDLAYKLVGEYKESLSLPSDVWRDSNQVDRAYVTVGSVNEKGNYQQGAIANCRLDADYKIRFVVSTVVDDSPLAGGQHYLLNIAMWFENGDVVVDVSKGLRQVVVSSPQQEYAFTEVCEIMKQVLLSGLTDPRLD